MMMKTHLRLSITTLCRPPLREVSNTTLCRPPLREERTSTTGRTATFFLEPKSVGSADELPAEGRPAGGSGQGCLRGAEDRRNDGGIDGWWRPDWAESKSNSRAD